MRGAALRIAAWVGTPITALLFAGLAFVSLPGAISTGDPVVIVSWIAQTFLQLVLLSVILFAQNESGNRVEALIRETHDAALEVLTDVRNIVTATHQHVIKEPTDGI